MGVSDGVWECGKPKRFSIISMPQSEGEKGEVTFSLRPRRGRSLAPQRDITTKPKVTTMKGRTSIINTKVRPDIPPEKSSSPKNRLQKRISHFTKSNRPHSMKLFRPADKS